MKLSLIGRFALAMFASLILGLGMTGCGGGTIAFIWVLGQQYNQIAGFKVDDFTGNLTHIPHEPFTSGGTNPVMLVVKPGGRYLYVLNQGTLPSTCTTASTCTTPNTGSNVAVFSVGGDGVLTLQQTYDTQGFNGQYIQLDSTGTHLYVLDEYAPENPITHVRDGNGAITAFAIDSTTGRLTLVTNQQSCVNGVCPTYFEVGSSQAGGAFATPFMMKTVGNCVYVANHSAVVPFSEAGGGQLATSTTSTVIAITGSSYISSITGGTGSVNLTDSGNDQLYRYNTGASCNLAIAGSGPVALASYNIVNPGYTLVDNSSQYVYVLGQSNSNTLPGTRYSSIGAFKVTSSSTGQLQFIGTYGTGSNPVCAVEDQSNQYIYTSNHNDGTISGNVFDPTTGELSPLKRGSTFTSTGQAECLAISNSID